VAEGLSAPVQIGRREVPYLIALLLGAAAYFLAAELGLLLASLNKTVSPVWPASGLAVAFLTICGRRCWPAILVGAWLANTFIGGPISAAAIAVGNMLEAVVAAEILAQLQLRRTDSFMMARTVGYMLASLIAPILSASTGTLTLQLATPSGAGDLSTIWVTWWAGDAIGILIIAPALLSLLGDRNARFQVNWQPVQTVHLALLSGLLGLTFLLSASGVAMAAAVFISFIAALLSIKWLGIRGGAWTALVIAGMILAQTALGYGAFANQPLNDRLLDAQVFVGALAFVSLVFSDLRSLDLRWASWIFCAGCALASVVFSISNHIEDELADERFAKVAEAATNSIRTRLEIYADSLRAAGAFYSASTKVSRRDWHDYVTTLDLISRYPGIKGIGVILPVAPSDADKFVADARSDGEPNFSIKRVAGVVNPRAADEDHLVIYYVEPELDNLPAIGLDISSEASRRKAALDSKLIGLPQITDPIRLVQDVQKRSAFLMFVPMYKPGLPTSTPAERQVAFRGWIYAAFVLDTLFREALRPWDQQVEVQIFNAEKISDATEIFSMASPEPWNAAARRDRLDRSLAIFGHPFTVRIWPGSVFPLESERASIALGAGLVLLATLLSALIANLQSLKEQATIIAREMTEALALSNERFELAIAGSQDGIWDWNLDDNSLWVSPRCREILGYADGDIADSIEDWRALIHPDDRARTTQAMRSLVQGDLPRLDIVQRCRHRNGNFVHVHNRALAVYRSDGRATRVIGALTDITPLLRAEERLRAAINVIDSGFALFDSQDRLVLFNESFLDEHTRRLMPDPTGMTFEEIFTRFAYDDVAVVDSLSDRATWLQRRIEMHRNPAPEPFEIALTDGRWQRVFERRLSDGSTVGIWTDITVLKLAERRLQDAIESINEGFALFDRDLRYVMVNSHLRDMYPMSGSIAAPGVLFEDALRYGAEHGEYPDVETPEEVDAFLRHWMSIFASDKPFLGEGVLKDGRWALISHHRTSDGGYVSIRADITALTQREGELELAKRQLEEKAIELTRLAEDRDRARRAADEANRGKSRFLANMSHELRTPLTAILGFSDVMSGEIFGPIEPPRYREYLDLIHESGEHLLSLINDILDLSKIEAGKMEIVVRAVSTADLVRQSSSLMRVMATQRGIDLDLAIAPDCPVLHADERAARQIILNLLSNSIKFTPAGGRVTLAVHTLADLGVEISVTDTGYGMTPDEADRAMQLYVQVDSDVARMALGTGIGLPLVKALAELHGGTIRLDSEKGKGTTVSVFLPWHQDLPRDLPDLPPASKRDRAATTASAPSIGTAEVSGRVLVVEDNAINQSLITVILNRMSLQVDCAADGLTGVEMAASKSYDLVIMDVQMPRLDGIEATERIRAMDGDVGRLPIIGLTADAEGPQRARCLEAGMTEVLAKPIVPRILAATVSELIHNHVVAPELAN
jgi:PAS domain S-box-containing protein